MPSYTPVYVLMRVSGAPAHTGKRSTLRVQKITKNRYVAAMGQLDSRSLDYRQSLRRPHGRRVYLDARSRRRSSRRTGAVGRSARARPAVSPAKPARNTPELRQKEKFPEKTVWWMSPQRDDPR